MYEHPSRLQMSKTTKTVGVITLMIAIAFTAAAMSGFVLWDKAKKIRGDYRIAMTKADSLAYEEQKYKTRLEIEIAKFSTKARELNSTTAALEALEKEVNEKEGELARLLSVQASLSAQKKVLENNSADLKAKIGEIRALKEDYVSQLASVSDEKATLTARNVVLTREKDLLYAKTEMLKNSMQDLKKQVPSDYFKVEILKKNNKATIRSTFADHLKLTFSVQDYKEVKDMVKNLKVEFVNKEKENLRVPIQRVVSESISNQEYSVELYPAKKLESGEYIVKLSTPFTYLGSAAFTLR